jgi:hypothetical protein
MATGGELVAVIVVHEKTNRRRCDDKRKPNVLVSPVELPESVILVASGEKLGPYVHRSLKRTRQAEARIQDSSGLIPNDDVLRGELRLDVQPGETLDEVVIQ